MMRVVFLVDGGYLSAVLKQEGMLSQDGKKVPLALNYELFCKNLTGPDEERVRTYYYTCMPYQSNPPTEEEKERYTRHNRFIYNLKRYNRFEVRLGRLKKIRDEFEQKRVDVLLSVDLVRMSWGKQIDRATIVTADSDFVPAVQAAKEAGVITKLAYSPSLPVNNELVEAFDERIEINTALLDKCKLNKEKRSQPSSAT
jgi:uncharacterized LabA/DUF88 family protein